MRHNNDGTFSFTPFLDSSLLIKKDKILTLDGKVIMMEWETEIMKIAAQTICTNRKNILNIGYGLGIIDNFIQTYNPKEHWIVEGHPQIQKKIIDEGWKNKTNVTLVFKAWQEVMYNLPKFDGIYIDTYGEDITPFIKNAHMLLNPGGILSFFTIVGKDEIQNDECFKAAKLHFDVKVIEVNLSNISKQDYWDINKKTYYHPVCTFKK